MTTRLLVVGTDTGVGKTAVACALLRAAAARNVRAVPFKPAASAEPGEPLDADRLRQAASVPLELAEICPLRYPIPLAPGIAHRAADFLDTPADPDGPLDQALAALDQLERRHAPDLTLIEGAGGLHVPMPGGYWQATWLTRFAAAAIVVGRLGLGTLNHTRLTIDALRTARVPVLGFVLVDLSPAPDPSTEHNARVLARSSGSPHLATVPRAADDADTAHAWIGDEVWHQLFPAA